ncbi:MAG: hypothetical protein Q4A78_06755 [Peptostreptococcaceae bacterium]|nr:hypothetical protein [Peptostreptococcaceae bacterium]
MKERFKQLRDQYIMSIDVETNGLWGEPFALAAIMYDPEGKEVDRLVARCPVQTPIHPFVQENVLPAMKDIEITHPTYSNMLKDFSDFWMKHTDKAIMLVHMGHICEARLIKDMRNGQFVDEFEAPFRWYDTCLFFEDKLQDYIKENGIIIDEVEKKPHSPLYDVIANYRAFRHFISE